MLVSARGRLGLRIATGLVLAFLYVPLIVVTVLSFSSSKTFTWPPPGLSLQWWRLACTNPARATPSSRR